MTIEADGDFTYVSDPADGCTDTSDFFDYTVSDGGAPTAGTDTGTRDDRDRRLRLVRRRPVAQPATAVRARRSTASAAQRRRRRRRLDDGADYLFLYGGAPRHRLAWCWRPASPYGQTHGLGPSTARRSSPASGSNPTISTASGTR